MPTHSENEFWFAQSANTTADLGLEVHSRFFYLSKSHTAMEINNERWFSERMNNNPKRHSRGKRNAKMKQQILRKENRKQAKYPQRPEYRQNVFLKQARKRGA